MSPSIRSSLAAASCELLLFFSLQPLTHLLGHRTAHILGRILAEVRDDNRNFTGLDLFRLFKNHLEKKRVDVVRAGKQDVLLRTTLAACADECVAILKVLVALHWRGYIVVRVERSAVEGIDQTNLVLADPRCVKETNREETGFRGAAQALPTR